MKILLLISTSLIFLTFGSTKNLSNTLSADIIMKLNQLYYERTSILAPHDNRKYRINSIGMNLYTIIRNSPHHKLYLPDISDLKNTTPKKTIKKLRELHKGLVILAIALKIKKAKQSKIDIVEDTIMITQVAINTILKQNHTKKPNKAVALDEKFESKTADIIFEIQNARESNSVIIILLSITLLLLTLLLLRYYKVPLLLQNNSLTILRFLKKHLINKISRTVIYSENKNDPCKKISL